MADKEINSQTNQEVVKQGNNELRRSIQHLPAFYRTDVNQRFTSSTIDPLIQKGSLERIDGFIGRRDAYTRKATDRYLSATDRDRMAYQLEPAVTYTTQDTTSVNPEDQVKFTGTYDDYINQIKYFGGKVDSIMMRIVDILYGLPFIIFIILLMVIFGRNLWLLFGAIGAVEWLTMARIVRGQVIGLKNQEFVMAAKAMGVSNLAMFRRHLLPNILGPIAVYATLTIPQVMLLEGFLSFLGLGIQPPMSSWGTLIKDGVESMEEYSWLLIYPGLTFTITLFALNFFGDGLRDALDPKTTDN